MGNIKEQYVVPECYTFGGKLSLSCDRCHIDLVWIYVGVSVGCLC